jgi:hypothetical protein
MMAEGLPVPTAGIRPPSWFAQICPARDPRELLRLFQVEVVVWWAWGRDDLCEVEQ